MITILRYILPNLALMQLEFQFNNFMDNNVSNPPYRIKIVGWELLKLMFLSVETLFGFES
jgi:hypothetical protein